MSIGGLNQPFVHANASLHILQQKKLLPNKIMIFLLGGGVYVFFVFFCPWVPSLGVILSIVSGFAGNWRFYSVFRPYAMQ